MFCVSLMSGLAGAFLGVPEEKSLLGLTEFFGRANEGSAFSYVELADVGFVLGHHQDSLHPPVGISTGHCSFLPDGIKGGMSFLFPPPEFGICQPPQRGVIPAVFVDSHIGIAWRAKIDHAVASAAIHNGAVNQLGGLIAVGANDVHDLFAQRALAAFDAEAFLSGGGILAARAFPPAEPMGSPEGVQMCSCQMKFG